MAIETRAPESKFAYVVVAARRARQLMAGAPPMLADPHSLKPTRTAIEELDSGVLEFELPPVPEGSDEDSKKRKG
jgi:DNA-directed RNA polymerase omega subunit